MKGVQAVKAEKVEGPRLCGSCGQAGHMKTSRRYCPRWSEFNSVSLLAVHSSQSKLTLLVLYSPSPPLPPLPWRRKTTKPLFLPPPFLRSGKFSQTPILLLHLLHPPTLIES